MQKKNSYLLVSFFFLTAIGLSAGTPQRTPSKNSGNSDKPVKEEFKDIGRAFKSGGRAVGHVFRKGAKSVGKALDGDKSAESSGVRK